MGKSLVIVESPTKAKTISKFLGKEYEVVASYGHIRDLPNKASEIPESIKKEKWSRLGVNVENDFEPLYIVPPEKKKRITELKSLLKQSSEILLATDEDREGESISWHLLEVLKPKVPCKRLVFHEITKSAIEKSLSNTREVDQSLVRAQETRRIIDRLFGYLISPVLWKKMMPGLSAGRVQSVALKLLVERERERRRFVRASYWDLSATFQTLEKSPPFAAELIKIGSKRVASGKDFDPLTGKINDSNASELLDETSAKELVERLRAETPKVFEVDEKPYTQKPYPPFTTSTLQQEASRKLSFAARRTMSVAQTLYENGFITYMRTDSTSLSNEGLSAARTLIKTEFGSEYLPKEPRIYKTKVKNAQEAHEAVRPAGENFAHPEDVKKRLGIEAFKLYDLIWKRTIACQMNDAHGKRITAQVELGSALFRASGKTIEFPGFLRAYVEGSDDPDAELADQETILPALNKGQTLSTHSLDAKGHETQPPPRYTEGSLIKQLEKLGIGRPSTWATIVDVVLNRSYAFKRGTALVPTFLADGVTNLMENHFTQLLDYDFTAKLEDDLDAISRGEINNLAYLNKFYNGNGHPGLQKLIELGEAKIDPREINGIPIGKLSDGRSLEVRIGRYGPFISDGENRASIPDMMPPDELTIEKAEELLELAAKGPEALGTDSESGKKVFLKTGRFGPYVQLGEAGEDKEEKPKMASLLPGMEPDSVTLETALALLSLPRSLGSHPETGDEITAANGRYGPYVRCGTESRSIPLDEMSPLTISLEQAVALLKEPKRRGGRAAAAPKIMKSIGKHPTTEKEITMRSGRYGPYVTDGEINASVPKASDPEAVTLEEAVSLLEARAAKIAENGGSTKRKSSAKKKQSTAKTKSKSSSKKKASTKKKTSSKASAAASKKKKASASKALSSST